MEDDSPNTTAIADADEPGINFRPVPKRANPMQLNVMSWFHDDIEMLWLPILMVGPGTQGVAQAKALAANYAPYMRGVVIRSLADCAELPENLPGWFIPANLRDTDVVCVRSGDELEFGPLVDPVTGCAMTFSQSQAADAPGPLHDEPVLRFVPAEGRITTLRALAAEDDAGINDWLVNGKPLQWKPILNLAELLGGLEQAEAIMKDCPDGLRLNCAQDFLRLPEGVKGWVLVDGASDSDVACGRWEGEVTFVHIFDRLTGKRLTYQTDPGRMSEAR